MASLSVQIESKRSARSEAGAARSTSVSVREQTTSATPSGSALDIDSKLAPGRDGAESDSIGVREAEAELERTRWRHKLRTPTRRGTEAEPGRVAAGAFGEHSPGERVRGQIIAARCRRTEPREGCPLTGREEFCRRGREAGVVESLGPYKANDDFTRR